MAFLPGSLDQVWQHTNINVKKDEVSVQFATSWHSIKQE
jgi:hypothetical protein